MIRWNPENNSWDVLTLAGGWLSCPSYEQAVEFDKYQRDLTNNDHDYDEVN